MKPSFDQKKQSRSQLLMRTAEIANSFLDDVADRPVAQRVEFKKLVAELSNGFQADGDDPAQIIEQLSQFADRAVVATAGPRYFGFVVGGSLPVALAADWLTAAWDQNGGVFAP